MSLRPAGAHTTFSRMGAREEFRPLAQNCPENHGNHEDHEHQRGYGTQHAELQKRRRGILAPTTGGSREPVLLGTTAFFHVRRVPTAGGGLTSAQAR